VDIQKVKQNDKSVVVAMEGEMDIYHATQVKDTLSQYLGEFDQMALDLSGVSDMDTAGFQILMTLKTNSIRKKKKFVLINHSPIVLKIFDLYGAVGFFGDKIKLTSGEREGFSFRYGMKKENILQG